jgi:hypothetical protein
VMVQLGIPQSERDIKSADLGIVEGQQ